VTVITLHLLNIQLVFSLSGEQSRSEAVATRLDAGFVRLGGSKSNQGA
jgi:hypothetical protein